MTAKKRKRTAGTPARPQTPTARIIDKRGRPIPEWKWWTFPVLMALSAGLVVGYFIGYVGGPGIHGVGLYLYIAVLGLFSLCLAHLAQRQVGDRLIRRRARARGLKIEEASPRTPPPPR